MRETTLSFIYFLFLDGLIHGAFTAFAMSHDAEDVTQTPTRSRRNGDILIIGWY